MVWVFLLLKLLFMWCMLMMMWLKEILRILVISFCILVGFWVE